METNYREIFYKAESSLKKHCNFDASEFESIYGSFKNYEKRMLSDREIFQMLVMIIFYSGFKAATVEVHKNTILSYFHDSVEVAEYDEPMVQRILSDPKMIRNESKIRSCITNAKTYNKIVKVFGSFNRYLDSFKPMESFENLLLLKEELEYKFEYLGGTTVYHFLTDLGFNVLKPDRVIARIFKRLGLIEDSKQLLKSVIQGRRFAQVTGLPIRYIDIIFVKYGQQGQSIEFGLDDGICLSDTPKCGICGLTGYCEYFNHNLKISSTPI